jgi:hypothetical protein
MKLIEKVGEHYELTDAAKEIIVFKQLYKRDVGAKKLRARKELAFIALTCDWDSPYVKNNIVDDLYEQVTEDVFGENTKWKPDLLVEKARTKYLELNESPLMKVLKACYTTLQKLKSYLEEVDFVDTDDKGALVHDPKKVMDIMNNLAKTSMQITELEKNIKASQVDASTVRGGFKPNRFSD